MNLTGLPPEMLLCITNKLCTAKDLLSFSLTNKEMYCIGLRALYAFNIEQQGSSALFWAAEHDKVQTAQGFLGMPGATADVVSEGDTPLILAAAFGSQLMIELLLKTPSTQLNALNALGQTALWCAAAENRPITVSRLLGQNGVLVDCPNVKNGWTPLAVAASNGHCDVVQCFLSDGRADLNAVDRDGRTPLFHAIEHNRTRVVKMLLTDPRIDVTCRNSKGCTPLLDAARRGFHSCMSILLDHPDTEVNVYDGFSLSPLWYAVGFCGVQTAQQLLDRGATANMIGRDQISPLQRAICLEDIAMVRLLLEHPGVRLLPGTIDAGLGNGQNPLFTAVRVGRIDIMELLLSRGLDTNIQDDEGRTPLLIAASIGCYEVVKQLFHHQDTNPCITDYYGRTALHEAARQGRLSVVQLLLSDSRVDLNAKDDEGLTPLWWATFKSRQCVALCLLDRDNVNVNASGRNQTTSLHHAVRAGNEVITRALLKREDVDPNVLSTLGHSPLSLAIQTGDVSLVQLLLTRKDLLLDADSPAKQPSTHGNKWKLVQTPLMLAIKEGHCEIAQALLQRTGSRINLQSWRGETALLLAARGGYTQVIEDILRNPAVNINLIDNSGRSALWWATHKRNTFIVRRLLHIPDPNTEARGHKEFLETKTGVRRWNHVIGHFKTEYQNFPHLYSENTSNSLLFSLCSS